MTKNDDVSAVKDILCRIALIADELTSHCLGFDADVRHITPLNYGWVLRVWKPDFLLVESVWRGYLTPSKTFREEYLFGNGYSKRLISTTWNLLCLKTKKF